MKAEEGFVPVPGGRVWYRSVGEGGVPLLCLHGGPGMTHNYIEPLEDLADRRCVVFYDQLGCGKSDRPGDTSLWTVAHFVEELRVVRDALGLDRLHLFGSSWGGMLAMQYVLDHQPRLDSLTLCGSPASIPRWIEGCNQLRAELPEAEREILARHEASGFTACPEYQGALVTFYRRHVCRLDPWPEGLERSFLEIGADVYETMNGPSEFTVVGNFKDWDVVDRLGEIRIPTLILSGRHDEARPDHMEEIHARIPGSELTIFEDASHLCFYERREVFMARMNAFLAAVES
ncbi:MAG TPA: proline iminopeptidase [Actinobacteria bacterium]|jgi:proline iminopeptidase|nr:proline iminopeptidase [Actinomycetota bacterium]